MMGRKINCIGCGRTDAGVHASQFYCHILVDEAFDFDPVFRLNKMLPDDIVVYELIPAPRDVHAQHDALSRTYEYHIHLKENPFLSELSTFYPKGNLDLNLMKKAAALLVGEKDFRAFCKQPDLYKNTLCKVSEAQLIIDSDSERMLFKITANRFLRGMVRLLVGNLLELGYGRMTFDEFEEYLNSGMAPTFFKSAYPQGLYLAKVEYGFI